MSNGEVTPLQTPVWVDGVTPLNSANMTQLQTRDEKNAPSGYVGLDASRNVSVAGQIIASGQIVANYNVGQQVQIDPSGVIHWGLPQDTNLYRAAAGILVTDGELRANPMNVKTDGQKYYFGPSYDTNLYRSGAGKLKTDGRFEAWGGTTVDSSFSAFNASESSLAFAAAKSSDNNYRIAIYADGMMNWSPGTSGADTTLYRSFAAVLKTDGGFRAAQSIVANHTAANQIDLDADGHIYFGSAADTSLYRYAAGWLVTNGSLSAGWAQAPGGATIGAFSSGDGWARVGISNDGYIRWSPGTSGADTTLYRHAAGQLRTGGVLIADSSLYVGLTDVAAKILLGGGDTNLYRATATVLKTDGSFRVGNYLDVDSGGTGASLRFGSAVDTNLYRSAAGVLKTDGILNAVGGLQVNGVPVGGGGEIAYAEFVSGYVLAGSAGGNLIVQTGSFTAPGGPVLIEFFCPIVGNIAGAGESGVYIYLDGTNIGAINRTGLNGGGSAVYVGVYGVLRTTLSAGSHSVAAYGAIISGQAHSYTGGTGAGGATMPTYVRVTKA